MNEVTITRSYRLYDREIDGLPKTNTCIICIDDPNDIDLSYIFDVRNHVTFVPDISTFPYKNCINNCSYESIPCSGPVLLYRSDECMEWDYYGNAENSCSIDNLRYYMLRDDLWRIAL